MTKTEQQRSAEVLTNGHRLVAQMMEAPITTLIRFWANHHLLDLVQRPVWRLVKDRSRSYVNAICAGQLGFVDSIRLASMADVSEDGGPTHQLKPNDLRIPGGMSRPGSGRLCTQALNEQAADCHMRSPAELRDVRTGCPVEAVESLGAAGPVRVRTAGGKAEEFDAVVLATHTDTSLALLGGACPPVSRDGESILLAGRPHQRLLCCHQAHCCCHQ